MPKYSVVVDLGDGATARLCFSGKQPPTEKDLAETRQAFIEMKALLEAKAQKKKEARSAPSSEAP